MSDHIPMLPSDELSEFILYTDPSGKVKVEIFVMNDTVWLTQQRIAELFGVDRTVVTKHLNNIFKEGELNKDSVSAIFAHTELSSSSPSANIFPTCLIKIFMILFYKLHI